MKIFLLCCAFVVLVGGCTTQQLAVIKTEGVIVTTVDTGMKGWALYVNAGKASPQQVAAVENAYNAYYDAQIIAENVLTNYIQTGGTNVLTLTQTSSAVQTAEASLLSLLNQYLK